MEQDRAADILSLLSHELRGPLGVIRGYLRLLEQASPALTDAQQRAVAAALKASDRTAELLTQTSLLANVQRGTVVLARRTVALADVLTNAVAEASRTSGKGLTFEPRDLPPARIDVDPAVLSNALANLMTAVVRARPSDPAIAVTAARDVRDGTAGVATRVAPPETTQADPHAVDITRGGHGLDLPIACALIAAQGGSLHELREGSRFAGVVVWLPTTP